MQLDRPIIHYLYNYYKNKDRGLYYEKEEVTAGSIAETEEELINSIRENLENPQLFSERRKEIKHSYLKYENKDSENIYQEIVKQLGE